MSNEDSGPNNEGSENTPSTPEEHRTTENEGTTKASSETPAASDPTRTEKTPTARPKTPLWQRGIVVVPLGLLAVLLGLVLLSDSLHDGDRGMYSKHGYAHGHGRGHSPHAKDVARCTATPKAGVVDQPVVLARVTVAAGTPAFAAALTAADAAGYVVIPVSVENTSTGSVSYSQSSWSLQTPEGRVLTSVNTGVYELGSGTLLNRGKVTAPLHFEVGTAKGQYQLSYNGSGCTGQATWTFSL